MSQRMPDPISVMEQTQLEEAIRESLRISPRPSPSRGSPLPSAVTEEADRALALAIQAEEQRKAIEALSRGAGPPPRASPAPTPSDGRSRRGSGAGGGVQAQILEDEELARRLQEQEAADLQQPPPPRSPGGRLPFPLAGTHNLAGHTVPRPARDRPPSPESPPWAGAHGGTRVSAAPAQPLTPLSPPPPRAPTRPGGLSKGCGRCQQPIGYGRYLNCLGRSWHPECFECAACHLPIAEQQFAVAGADAFHVECHRNRFQPRCVVCDSFIPANADGLIEYRSHPFWGDKYCPSHEGDGTARCCGCERLEPHGLQYVELEDHRRICLECTGTVVVDTGDCQPLYQEVLAWYRSISMPIKQEIPMLCVERSALNDAVAGEKGAGGAGRGHTHVHQPEARGLCLSEEQTVRMVVRRPHREGESPLARMNSLDYPVRRHCEVTAVLVLYGLPRLLTGSILAHELMHAWIRLEGSFRNLAPEVEEGICQVMAYTWLRSKKGAGGVGGGRELVPGSAGEAGAGGEAPVAEKHIRERLREFFLHQIAMDPSPVYGNGFRAGHAAVTKLGLKQTLEHIRLTGTFPITN